LGASISELKGQAEKIMIRFRPGSGRIPVGAMLNGTFRQSFLVDTGASLVTVPSSTIEALGIEVGANNPRRKTSTAGGMVIVPEVVFSSIEVGGWTTHNVKALVLDIPNHPGLGLLGLNYLRRFHMEINDREGVFFLKPR
jgi:clan AA aspartic protease (TIGR02281 family)